MGYHRSPMHRRRVIVEPHFQLRFTARFAAWVAFATCVTGLMAWAVIAYVDSTASADLFLVSPEGGPQPSALGRTELILPTVLAALALNLTLSVLAALFYSRRLAGPVHKLRLALQKLTRGEPVDTPFRLRREDEFHPLASDFEAWLRSRSSR